MIWDVLFEPFINFGFMRRALLGCVATQPFDVIKTRMMTQAAASSAAPYASALDCVRTMWRTEGPASLYSGLWQRALYSGPLWAAQFGANSALCGVLRRRKGIK